MGATDQDAALAVVQATSVPIHDIGTAAYLSPDIAGWAADWGWSNPFAFYFAGRRGPRAADVLGAAGAIPGPRRHKEAARRGGGHHRPALRDSSRRSAGPLQ